MGGKTKRNNELLLTDETGEKIFNTASNLGSGARGLIETPSLPGNFSHLGEEIT